VSNDFKRGKERKKLTCKKRFGFGCVDMVNAVEYLLCSLELIQNYFLTME